MNFIGNLILYNLFHIFISRYNVKQKKALKNQLIMQEEKGIDYNTFTNTNLRVKYVKCVRSVTLFIFTF